MATHLEITRKRLIDAIARELYGWPNGERHTYDPDELPFMAARLRRKAELYVAMRDGVDIDPTGGGKVVVTNREAPTQPPERCGVARTNTGGTYYCSREPGHDGPCAAWLAHT